MNGFTENHKKLFHCIPFFIERVDSVISVKRFGILDGVDRQFEDSMIEFVIEFSLSQPLTPNQILAIDLFYRMHMNYTPSNELYIKNTSDDSTEPRKMSERQNIENNVNWIWTGKCRHSKDHWGYWGDYATLKEWFILNCFPEMLKVENDGKYPPIAYALTELCNLQYKYDYFQKQNRYLTNFQIKFKE